MNENYDSNPFFADRDFDNLITVPMTREDYGDGCFSFGYDFSSLEMQDIPELTDFSFKVITRPNGDRLLWYCSEGDKILIHPCKNVDYFITKYNEHLLPHEGGPYVYMDLDTQFTIHELNGYIYLLNFTNIASSSAWVYRVKSEDYCKAYEAYLNLWCQ